MHSQSIQPKPPATHSALREHHGFRAIAASFILLSSLVLSLGHNNPTAIAQTTRQRLATPDRSANHLGTAIDLSYTGYCQPEYPPIEKPICLLGLGDKLPDGDELAPEPDTTETQIPTVTETLPPIAPIPYQYDKAQLFPRF